MKVNVLHIIIVLCVISLSTRAQQLPQSTQHMFNKFTLNPAVAGSEKYLEAGIWHRSQWTGFENAPVSDFLTVQSSFYQKKSGVGGYVFNDAIGQIRNTGMNLSYAYHLPVSKEIKFSMGMGFNLSRYMVDGNKIELYHSADPLIDQTTISTTTLPEASVGGYLYHNDFYFGISALNIINNKTEIFENLGTNASMQRETNINIIGSYRIKIEKGIYFIPSFYINKVINNPMQTDINLRIDYTNFLQFGFTYRTQDALALLVGVRFLKDFIVSYSYDLQFSELQNHSNGSHEIMLRYQLFYNAIYAKMHQSENYTK